MHPSLLLAAIYAITGASVTPSRPRDIGGTSRPWKRDKLSAKRNLQAAAEKRARKNENRKALLK